MKIKLKLKSKVAIKAVLETSDLEGEEGIAHTDGIPWHNIDTNKEYTLSAVELEYEFADLKVVEVHNGNPIYISPKWVQTYTAGTTEFKFDPKQANEKYIKVNQKWFNLETNKMVKNIPSCKCCGVPTTNDDLCDTCTEKLTEKLSYDYKPEFKFHGTQLKADQANPVWYGIELEYALDSKAKMASVIHKADNALYLKSDSSISGGEFKAEMVSHPHSFKALTGPTSPLALINTLDVAENSNSCGCHIHISRTAFRSNKHFSLFYFLVNSNRSLLEFIGDRELTHHCKLETSGKIYTKENTHKGAAARTRVVNENNKDTVEVRFFNSTNSFAQVKIYLQFLESLIKYTNYHATTVSFKGWMSYINKYKRKYLELQQKLATYEKELPNSITFRPPTIEVFNFSDLTVTDIKNLKSITRRGKVIELHKNEPEVTLSQSTINFRNTNGNYDNYDLSEITDATIEKE